MKIKVNDTVKVLSGKDAGKTGKVTQVLTGKNNQAYVIVEGVNTRKKHLRARGQAGQVISFDAPLHASNVQVVDPSSSKPTRVGFKMNGSAKERIAKRSGEALS